MAASPAFLQLASSAIENEIRTYFPDTALYRRLCWGGLDGGREYLHREFSPDPRTARRWEAKVKDSFCGEGDTKTASLGQCARTSTSPPRACPPLKRRRTNIVEELQKGLRSMDNTDPSDGRLPGALLSKKQSDVSQVYPQSSSAQADSAVNSAVTSAPFAVTCQRCTSRVTSTYPCHVMKGYVVLWAESVVEVSCVPKQHRFFDSEAGPMQPLSASETAATAVTGESGKYVIKWGKPAGSAVSSLLFLGLRPLLRRRTYTVASAPRCVSAFAAEVEREDVNRCKVEKRGRTATAETSKLPSYTTGHFTLHSLHIANDDAVTHVRPASFALQSVLQPGLPTALECYPRHMIHFGLLCFAAWRATPDMWRTLMEGRNEGEESTATDPNGRTDKRIGKPFFWESLVPHSADDAVLILGLGGNVLGACLDAVLPSVVPLHTVEVEPAVLQACEEHHQFPPCGASSSPVNGGKRSTTGLKGTGSKGAATATSERMRPQRVLMTSPNMWREMVDQIDKESGSSLVFASLRQGNRIPNCTNALGDAANQSWDIEQAVPGEGVTSSTCAKATASGNASPPALVRRSASPCTEHHGEYLCFLQDAYAFLRQAPHVSASRERPKAPLSTPSGAPRNSSKKGMKRNAAATRTGPSRVSSFSFLKAAAQKKAKELLNGELRSNSGAQISVPAVACCTPVQYSMIFLDCYDPDREHMMHEGGLIDLCARRLRPGGVLLVNAHVLPTAANLERDFLTRGFATVQALRVSGCTQTVVVCVTPDAEMDQKGGKTQREEKCARFTMHQLQQLAHQLNALCVGSPPPWQHATRQAAATPSHGLLRSGFLLDASWLKACRRMSVSQETKKKDAEVDFRVWQHYF
ncbi:hypothetical protein ABB37_01627 [Leptomonas pyrrhocoris]|uniref:Uncharacterized protein n=1 Tax=Leptomonas pyrrhocoris TaxID=157538 RepID=A0A0M9G9C6_LEPPY|nr:hypothetical protein ABB37_01627 [Leptomonas pyrrhocoris]KPA85286.1 hypothetical protein ABB37_01627 [Leptomonas pyrrhocoris]|eukprot:XP_015663725.1 hypothetical protein ABB37_01627 [Leptomonas pyrrhocoris]